MKKWIKRSLCVCMLILIVATFAMSVSAERQDIVVDKTTFGKGRFQFGGGVVVGDQVNFQPFPNMISYPRDDYILYQGSGWNPVGVNNVISAFEGLDVLYTLKKDRMYRVTGRLVVSCNYDISWLLTPTDAYGLDFSIVTKREVPGTTYYDLHQVGGRLPGSRRDVATSPRMYTLYQSEVWYDIDVAFDPSNWESLDFMGFDYSLRTMPANFYNLYVGIAFAFTDVTLYSSGEWDTLTDAIEKQTDELKDNANDNTDRIIANQREMSEAEREQIDGIMNNRSEMNDLLDERSRELGESLSREEAVMDDLINQVEEADTPGLIGRMWLESQDLLFNYMDTFNYVIGWIDIVAFPRSLLIIPGNAVRLNNEVFSGVLWFSLSLGIAASLLNLTIRFGQNAEPPDPPRPKIGFE